MRRLVKTIKKTKEISISEAPNISQTITIFTVAQILFANKTVKTKTSFLSERYFEGAKTVGKGSG